MPEPLDFAASTTHIKLDLFPATISQGPIYGENNPVVFEEARLIVTNDYIYVILMGNEGPYFALKEELVDFAYHTDAGYRIDGAINQYTAVRDGNCGCGTRLRGMRFLPGVGHVQLKIVKP